VKAKNIFVGFVFILSAFVLVISCSQKKAPEDPEFMGYIENTQVNITTRIPGKIVTIAVDEGDTVKENQVVTELDKRELLANKQAMEAQLANIKINRNRLQNLYKAGAVPQQKLDEIETAYQVVSQKIAALNVKLNDMTIVSPINGIVNVRVLEEGQMMPPGMPVVVVTDTSKTWARFSIPESYLNQVKLGQMFEIASAIPGETLQAKVVQIMPMADFAIHTPTTLRQERDVRSFSVKMKISKGLELCKPGMYVYLKLKPLKKEGEA